MNEVKMHKQEAHGHQFLGQKTCTQYSYPFVQTLRPYSESLRQSVKTHPLILILGQKIVENRETA